MSHRLMPPGSRLLCLVVLWVAAMGYGAKNLTFTNDYRVFFGEDNPQLVAFENLQDTYAKNDNAMFVLAPADGNVFTQTNLAAIAWLTERAWETPYSTRVESITNYQHTSADGDDLLTGTSGAEVVFPGFGNDIIVDGNGLVATPYNGAANIAAGAYLANWAERYQSAWWWPWKSSGGVFTANYGSCTGSNPP